MRRRVHAAVLGAAALSLALTSCGLGPKTVTYRNQDDTIIIGVSATSPGLGFVGGDGAPAGFDVAVARYVAHGLGWSEREIRFRPVAAAERTQVLQDAEVDLVVSTFTITEARRQLIDFAGPYFTAGQDLMVLRGDREITGPHRLDGRTVCAIGNVATDGAGPAERPSAIEVLTSPAFSPAAIVKDYQSPTECADAVAAGEVDAATGDDVVLAGYVLEHGTDLKVVSSPFTTDYYGIGIRRGSPDIAAIDEVLRQMVADGSWQRAFDASFAGSGYVAPTPPTPGAR